MNRARFLTAASLAAGAVVGVRAAAAALRVRVGDTIYSSTGAWLGNPTWFTYRFQRHTSGAPWQTLQDSESNAYQIAATDAGYQLRVQVTAYNPSPSQPATSKPISIVHS